MITKWLQFGNTMLRRICENVPIKAERGLESMKKIIAIILAMGTFLCMTACQATPEKDIIVLKDAERMVEQAADENNGTGLDSLVIPEGRYTYESAEADGALHINVDASVEKPDSGDMPIVRVCMSSFSQETVTAIFNYLFPDGKPYDKARVQTKADIEPALLNLQKQLADGSYKDNGFTEEEFRTLISNTEAQYADAPETAPEKTVSDGTMKLLQEKGVYMLDVESDTASLQVINSPVEALSNIPKDAQIVGGCLVNYRSNTAPQYNTLGITRTDGTDIPDDAKGKLTIPYADAKAFCDGFFAAAGMDGDFSVGASFIVDDRGTGLVDGTFVDGKYVEGPKEPAKNYAYQFYYTRKVSDIPVAVNPRDGGTTGDGFSIPWCYEYACFTVDNSGLEYILWTDPLSVGETVEESSKLKSFEEIMQVFETMIKTTYEAYMDIYYSGNAQMEVNVDDIQLCLLRIREQNGDDTAGLLVPAWVFYGHNIIQGDDGVLSYDSVGGASTVWPQAPIVLLAVNAIDGSVIDIAKGY
jgi:hypothetical protein